MREENMNLPTFAGHYIGLIPTILVCLILLYYIWLYLPKPIPDYMNSFPCYAPHLSRKLKKQFPGISKPIQTTINMTIQEDVLHRPAEESPCRRGGGQPGRHVHPLRPTEAVRRG